MYWLTKWYETLRLSSKLHDIVSVSSTNGVRRFREFSDSPNGTTRFYYSQNQLPCLDLILRIFFRFVECYWARLPFVECYNSCDSDHSYLTCIIIVYTVYSKTADWSLSTTLECVLFGILWLFLGACVKMYVSQHKENLCTRSTNFRKSIFAYKKNDFLPTPPPGLLPSRQWGQNGQNVKVWPNCRIWSKV